MPKKDTATRSTRDALDGGRPDPGTASRAAGP